MDARLGSPLPAFEFLTTLRVRHVPVRSASEVAGALWAFPLAGLAVGLALFGLERGGRELAPDLAVAAVLVAAWVGLTGGLHLDGLADCCDGLFGGRDRSQRLAIMHDTATGTWGIVAVTLSLLLKVALLSSLPAHGRFGALLLAPVVARAAIVALMGATPYARPTGYGRELHARAWGAPAAVAVALALGAAGALFGPEGLVVVAAVLAVGALGGWYAVSRLGGLTGDVDGGLIESMEVAALLALVVGLDQDWLDPLLWDGG